MAAPVPPEEVAVVDGDPELGVADALPDDGSWVEVAAQPASASAAASNRLAPVWLERDFMGHPLFGVFSE